MSDATNAPRTEIRVVIAGEEYTLRTDADEAYTRRCAALVDERMRAVGGEVPPHATKTAIMAALSLSDELFQQQARVRDRARALAGRLDDALGD